EISFGQQAFFGIGAYAGGMTTAMAGWPLAAGLLCGALAGAAAAAFVGAVAVRLYGIAFAVASLAFAETMRIALELFRWQVTVAGEAVGPLGVEGFRGIRAVFDAQMSEGAYLALVGGCLGLTLLAFGALERSRYGVILRQVGADATLAAHGGVPVVAVRLMAITASGALAGLGGAFYAHQLTYVEPRNFDMMLGVHSLAYGLIGGLGTVFGPILGVIIDIGLVEASRLFGGWRMVVFGGLVALILIWRPRGLLDENTVRWLTRAAKRTEERPMIQRSASLAALLVCLGATAVAAQAPNRTKAAIACQPAKEGKFTYDCVVTLSRAQKGDPIAGAEVVVGADMPSMPMAHNVKPVAATAGEKPGEYRVRLALEMYGDWAVHVTVGGPVRDKVVEVLNFTPTTVAAATARKAPATPGHTKHHH
ncbi:MAG: hypothetical protein RL291_103, partial [Pseudomonadota bacterium]